MRYEVAIKKGCSKASPTYESYEDGTIKGLSIVDLLVSRAYGFGEVGCYFG